MGPVVHQRGLTLVEVMVALAIGMLLIAGVAQVFLASRQSYRFQEALSRVQENGRYATELISRDIRQTGFAGCASLVSITPSIVAPSPPLVAYGRGAYMLGLASVTAANPFLATPGTDVLTLRMLQPDAVVLSDDMVAVNDSLTIAANPRGFGAGDILAVADCNAMDIFRADAVAGTGPVTLAPNANLGQAYLQGALLTRFNEVSYFIRPGASGVPALWRRDFGGDMELIEGVEDLWLRYGIDLDNNGVPDVYLQADAVTDWGQVRSARLSLLLVSTEDRVNVDPQPFTFRGVATVPADNRLRQVVTTTVGLRNRLP